MARDQRTQGECSTKTQLASWPPRIPSRRAAAGCESSRPDCVAAGRERVVSAVERKPAQRVAHPLVVEHKVSDLVGELGALPLALQAAGRHAVVFRRCRPRRP